MFCSEGKDVIRMSLDALVEEINEQLDCKTVFTIPCPGADKLSASAQKIIGIENGGFAIKESVVVTWIIMAVLVLLAIILVRNLKVENPGKKQLALESFVKFFYDFFDNTLEGKGKEYYYYLMTVIIYIGFANIIGIFGFKPPTKDLSATAALSIMSIFLIQISGFRARKLKGWAHSFLEPMPILLPINIMELGIKPLSLCMRLFGNVLGSFIIMELVKAVVPAVLPITLSLYFDIFDGFIQAYVFVFLTALFMGEAMETEEE